MRRRLVFGVLCLCLFGVIAAPAGAVGGGTREIVLDETGDFGGPRAGYLYYNQRANGSIQMSVVLKNAPPNDTYSLHVSCFPFHLDPRIDLPDIVTTDAAGRGKNTSIVIGAATLAFCGSGDIQGHFDLHAGSGNFALYGRG